MSIASPFSGLDASAASKMTSATYHPTPQVR
jgi:hypothetical protein